MHLHLVGGFLGSGKTTAIVGAAQQLVAGGQRVGVVTNDQGRYLVDTAFVRLSAAPTVEVTGGCFCCRYDDLEARLAQLQAAARPDVIFAEAVGSCADLVATVLTPLQRLRPVAATRLSFSVFVDARLLRRRLLGLEMPFSDEVIYLFDQQLAEAGLLVVNKVDLLAPAEAAALAARVRARYPAPAVLLQNSLDPASVARWLAVLESGDPPRPSALPALDYGRYGAGEARLAWLDATFTVAARPGEGRAAIVALVGALVAALRAQQVPIGHLKAWVQSAAGEAKLSVTALDGLDWEAQLPARVADDATVLINTRVELAAPALRALMQEVVAQATAAGHATYTESAVAAFHPAFPTPTHRLATDEEA